MLGENSNTFIVTGANWADDIVNQTATYNMEYTNKFRGIVLFHGTHEKKCKDLMKNNANLVKGTSDNISDLINVIC